MKDLKFIPAVSAKQMYSMNATAFPKDDARFVRSWYPNMDRCYYAEYKDGLISAHTRSIDTCFGRMCHAAISYNPDNVTFAGFDPSAILTWDDMQIVKDNVIDYDRFAVEVYPKSSKLVDMSNVYHLFAFDELCKNPFNIKKKFNELNEPIILGGEEYGFTINTYSANGYNGNYTFPYRIGDKSYMVGREYKIDNINPNLPANIVQALSTLSSIISAIYVGLIEVEIKKEKYKVYHTIIQPKNDCEEKIVWNIKETIKDMIFGTERAGIEIYPKARDLVDDGHYHMFVFEKEVDIPFGIHRNETKYMKAVNRGPYILNQAEMMELQQLMRKHKMFENMKRK